MILRRLRRAPAGLPDEQLRTAWQAISLLIDYPSQPQRDLLPTLRGAIAVLPDAVAQPLSRLIDALAAAELQQLQRDYVETFDHTRKCCLYLTYFRHGDTRTRGVALVQFKQLFRAAGLELDDSELPDHLAVVLEFGATADQQGAWKLLADHRAGIEMLRLALLERDSRWADAIVALCATLPALQGDEQDAIRRLIVEGPPSEPVGLEPYAIDPKLNHRPTPTFVGATIPVGAQS